MRGARARGVAALLLTVAAAACSRHTPPRAVAAPDVFDFARVADSIIAAPPLDRAHLGIRVYDPVSRRVLYDHNARRRFVPASNQKLLPTATALHELGPDYRYRTPLYVLGRSDSIVHALVVVGRGDPTMSARFHAGDHAVLDRLADSVAAAGIRRVTGDLIIDASAFDAAIIPGAWTFGNLNGTSAPPSGAFAVAEGLFRVRITGAATAGAPAHVEVVAPPGVVPLQSRVTTVAAGARAATSVSRGPWNDTLRINGAVAAGDTQTLRLPMTDPVRFAAHAFAQALHSRGVRIDGGIRVVVDAAESAALRGGRVDNGGSALAVEQVAAWTSPPLRDIVAAILGPSQNWMAEQLVRTLGAEKGTAGSWSAGLAVQRAFLFDAVGIDSAALRMNDGSGMSPQNLVTPEAVVQLLAHAREAPWRDAFRAALATPNRPGTLSGRLRGLEGRLEGKTGTLNSVNALSGYVRAQDGRELIFSIMSNASGLASAPVVEAIDRMVEALARGAVPRE